MNSARPSLISSTNLEKVFNLADDSFELPSFLAVFGGNSIAMHRITNPNNRITALPDGFQEWRQYRTDRINAHSGNKG